MRPGAGKKERDPRWKPTSRTPVAAILSIVETCRSLKIPVRDYLAAVLPGTGHVLDQSRQGTDADRLAGSTVT